MNISRQTVKYLNNAIQKIYQDNGKAIFDEFPLKEIEFAFLSCGYHLVNEDGTPFEAMFCGEEGYSVILYADGHDEIVDNSRFIFQWYKYPNTGHYDINMYVS